MSLLKEFRDEFYLHAERGLQPISWDALLPGPGTGAALRARPIEMLALQQCKADQERRVACDHFRSTLLTVSSPRSMERWLREADECLVAHWSATVRRREQAWHYGMLVCRAFFKSTSASVSALVPDKVARAQEVVELIEQFITG